MSGVREVRMEAVEEPRSGVPSGEPEASREVRWSARRKEQVVLRLAARRVVGSVGAGDGAAGRADRRLAGGVPRRLAVRG